MRKRRWISAMVMLLGSAVCWPGIAPAADQEHDEGAHDLAAADQQHGDDAHAAESKSPLESGSFSNALATVITFGIVVFVLGRFVWPRLLKVLKDREDFIRKSLETAKRDRDEAEKLLKDYHTQIERSRQEATAIVDEGRRDAEVLRRKIHEEARAEADSMVDRARREIKIARDTAVKDLYTLAGDLATDLAGKILQRELDPKAHEQLIEDSIDQIARMEGHN